VLGVRTVPALGVADRTRYPRPLLPLGLAGARQWSRSVRELERRGTLDPNSIILLQVFCQLTDVVTKYREMMRQLGAGADDADHLPGWRNLRAEAGEALGLAPELTVLRSRRRRTRRMPRGPHGPPAPGGLAA
jgi:phage terminase small subunit